MEAISRHQCLIYEGSPAQTLSAVAEAARQKLNDNYRCVYLNSPTMVAGMKSYLAATGTDVAEEISQGRLVLSSLQSHLTDGRFDMDRMLHMLEDNVQEATSKGYKGFWASGDMTWELGPQPDFRKLAEYEWRLEELFRRTAQLSGICQYHKDTLPRDVLRLGLRCHASLFVNETLSLINSHYAGPGSSASFVALEHASLDKTIALLIASQEPN